MKSIHSQEVAAYRSAGHTLFLLPPSDPGPLSKEGRTPSQMTIIVVAMPHMMAPARYAPALVSNLENCTHLWSCACELVLLDAGC